MSFTPLSGSTFDAPLSRPSFDPIDFSGSLPSSQLYNRREPALDLRLDPLRDRHDFERNELLLSSRPFDIALSRYDSLNLQDEPRYGRFEPERQGRFEPEPRSRFEPERQSRFEPERQGRFEPERQGRFEPERQGRYEDLKPQGEGGYGRYTAAWEDLGGHRPLDRLEQGMPSTVLSSLWSQPFYQFTHQFTMSRSLRMSRRCSIHGPWLVIPSIA